MRQVVTLFGAIPDVNVCHGHTSAVDSLRVVSRAVPSPTAQGRDGVARKRFRLCQATTVPAVHSSVSGVQIDHSPEVFVDGSQNDHNVGRHAILAANVEDGLPVTLPATSGQVRALYEEEGRRISPVNSIRRATHVDSSDHERFHTTQFDMTAGDTVPFPARLQSQMFLWNLTFPPRILANMDVFEFGSQSVSQARRQLMLCLKLSW